MAKIKLDGYRCERCKHVWVPRDKDIPRICPSCKSPYWDIPRGILGKKRKKLGLRKMQPARLSIKSVVKSHG